MAIQLVHFSDCGPVRAKNQDAYCALAADTAVGQFSLLAVCDGMGGLSNGEVASATVIQDFTTWFTRKLPMLLKNGRLQSGEVFSSWNDMLQESHNRLKRFAAARQISWGTTLSAVLLTEDTYYVLHVGDSRAYLDDGETLQLLTKDETLAMRELEAGRISADQYAQDPRKNVLLQCIGYQSVTPGFRMGDRPASGALLLCSDGFYHTVAPEEAHQILSHAGTRAEMNQYVRQLAVRARRMGETDNMTAVILRWDNAPSRRESTVPLAVPEMLPQADEMDFLAKVISIHATPL